MTRLSATLTRRVLVVETDLAAGDGAAASAEGADARASDTTVGAVRCVGLVVDRASSSQTSMDGFPIASDYESVVYEHQALLDIRASSMLRACIAMTRAKRCRSASGMHASRDFVHH